MGFINLMSIKKNNAVGSSVGKHRDPPWECGGEMKEVSQHTGRSSQLLENIGMLMKKLSGLWELHVSSHPDTPEQQDVGLSQEAEVFKLPEQEMPEWHSK